jgi:GTP-binding protein EngB required for normal cell division
MARMGERNVAYRERRWDILQERDHLEDLNISQNKIVKLIFKVKNERGVNIGVIFLKMDKIAGFLRR